MSVERLRNVKTGEIRDAETNSDEYQDLINEIYDHDGSARPKWEITGQHHARRLDEGEIQEEDLGYEFKPVPGALIDISDIGPELYPERALSPGEVESGIETHEAKLEGMPSITRDHSANPALRNAEPLERAGVDERLERGREMAGSSGKRSSRSSKRSEESSGSGTAGSETGSSAKASSSGSSSRSTSGSTQGASGSGSSGSGASGKGTT